MDQLGATFTSSRAVGNYFALAIFVITATFGIAARYRVIVVQWLNGFRGQDWPQTSAVIDLVTVVPQTEQTRYGERVVGYLVALTYFYRNPELQMGEYSRMFNLESDAKAWADSYKGRNVMIHVDPRDPSRSILRKEEL